MLPSLNHAVFYQKAREGSIMRKRVNKIITYLIFSAFVFTSIDISYVSSYINIEKDALRGMATTENTAANIAQALSSPLNAANHISDIQLSPSRHATAIEIEELIESFILVDPVIFERVEGVEVVQVISSPPIFTKEPIESKLDLMHVQNVAAMKMIKWINDIGSEASKEFADASTARWTRDYYNRIKWLNGRVVIGEGERDEAPMLYIGESVGAGRHSGLGTIPVDIAGDVLELTNGVNTDSIKGTVSTAAYTEAGGIRSAPDIYITYWKIGPQAKDAEISVDLSPAENLENISRALSKEINELKGAILFRERHINRLVDLIDAGVSIDKNDSLLNNLINAVRTHRNYINDRNYSKQDTEKIKIADELLEGVKTAYKALDKKVKEIGVYVSGNIYLLSDGDLMPVFGFTNGMLDFMTGAGGAPEGELSAAALIAMDGRMSARYCTYERLKEAKWGADLDKDWNRFTEKEKERLKSFGLVDPDSPVPGKTPWDKVWTAQELVSGKGIVFIASAVKDSPWLENLKGVVFDKDSGLIIVHTLRATKAGDIRIWKISYMTPAPGLRAEIAKENDLVKRAELYYDLALIYGRLGYYEDASDILSKLPTIPGIDSNNMAKYNAAFKYYLAMHFMLKVQDTEQIALDLFEEAHAIYYEYGIRARERIFTLAQFIGDSFVGKKQFDEALSYYSRASRIRPDDTELLNKIQKTQDIARFTKSSSGTTFDSLSEYDAQQHTKFIRAYKQVLIAA
jgi:fructose-1,6-bisphosphatase/sedoheptulose 1,7-bisphosphatase-like protein